MRKVILRNTANGSWLDRSSPTYQLPLKHTYALRGARFDALVWTPREKRRSLGDCFGRLDL